MRAREGEGKRARVVVSKGNATGVDGCIVEAHALELDEHLSLHIRVSIFFPLASGSLSFSLSRLPRSSLSRFYPFPLFHPFHLFRWPFISKGPWANANFLVK